ncbi:MAG: aspartate kinase [Clostridia bacterium]|nr:aspartate kinase [Clostridia bacterium]
MNITVQKYGGSSVENKEKLEIICNKIINEKNKENNLVIVVSAQGKTTNELISKAEEYTDNNLNLPKKDLDFLLSTGEMQTASLLSLMLNTKGHKCVCLTGAQAGIITNSEFGNAKIIDIVTSNILSFLEDDYIVIVTGFQGIDTLGNITTLGRGGSDLSAVALAAALNAQKCEIFSDIDGIYSADPKVIPNSKLLDEISFDEMLEASSAGAKVLHNRSVNLAKKYNIKISSKNTFTNSRGSIVQKNLKEDFDIHFITKKDDVSKICIVGPMMLSNKDAISKIFKVANEENIEIYMISFSELAINLIVDTKKSQYFMEKLHEILIDKQKDRN